MKTAVWFYGGSGYPDQTGRERKEVLLYAFAVIITSTLIVACFPVLHITNNWAGNALMFIPGLMALAFRLRIHDGLRSVGWGRGQIVYWLWAILLPVIALLMSLPLSIRLGYAALAPASTAIGRLASNPTKLVETMLIYIAISIPFAFAEEFGWRGYAQGKLVRSFGLLNGLLLLGVIWGFWHTPIYYFMGNFPDHPILGPFVMTPIDNILAVIPMAWLYIRSRNIWVPTLAHAFADVLWGFSGLIFPTTTQEVRCWALLQAAQLIISIVLL
ncbi:MAG TPA: type II CAAX endopeptidase family protein [Bryobacteraceae bacterium]|nr:type II CAAX endopeptidase family protein [Bryobacteraceae bacterium]